MRTIPSPVARDVRARVISVFEDVLAEQELDESLSVQDDLDSLDRITLLMALEDEFDVSINEATARSLTTLDALTAFVESESRREPQI